MGRDSKSSAVAAGSVTYKVSKPLTPPIPTTTITNCTKLATSMLEIVVKTLFEH